VAKGEQGSATKAGDWVREGEAEDALLAGEDQALLVRGDALLVLDLGLDVVDGVRRLHLQGDRLTRKAGWAGRPRERKEAGEGKGKAPRWHASERQD
jgi:hypothetical protein